MKTRNFLMFFLAAVLFAAAIETADAQIDTNYFGYGSKIIVSLSKQEPDPVEPGKEVEVSFKLDNNGTAAGNVVFEILPEYPFSIPPGQSSSNYIGTLGTSQYGKYSVTLKYKLEVAQDAADNNYKIKARYKVDNYDSWITVSDFVMKVQSTDAILAVDKILNMPQPAAPGQRTKLTINLKNYANSLLKNIKVSLSLAGTSDNKIPFSPIGSTNEKVISYIEPQASANVDFDLLVDSDATSKAYKVPLNVGYSDALNKNYSKSSLITLVVGAEPDLGLALERTDVYTTDSTGSAVLRLVNKGPVDIKFLNVKVLQNENVTVIGGNEIYIGKLDSDDFSTAEFKVYLKGKDSVKIPVEVTYKDTNGNNYKERKEVEIRLYSSSEAKNFGVKKSSQFTWIVLAVLIIGAAYYYYRRRSRKK